MKHDPKEVAVVCSLIEEYADKRAEAAAIEATVEELIEMNISKEKIIDRLKFKYNLNDEQIAAYLENN